MQGFIDPEPLALPRVGRKRNRHRRHGPERAPFGCGTALKEPRKAFEHIATLVTVATRRRDGHSVRPGLLDRIVNGRQQDRMRTDLDERVESIGEQLNGGVVHTYRLAEIAHPVDRIETCAVELLRIDCRIQGDLRRTRLDES